jgi:hypothetical protein
VRGGLEREKRVEGGGRKEGGRYLRGRNFRLPHIIHASNTYIPCNKSRTITPNPPTPFLLLSHLPDSKRRNSDSQHSTSTNSPNLSLLSLLSKSPPSPLGHTHGLTEGLRSWKVVRRYSDFVTFDASLGSAFSQPSFPRTPSSPSYTGVLAALPELPPKSYWWRWKEEFLKERVGGLQEYLNALCGTSFEVHRSYVVREVSCCLF